MEEGWRYAGKRVDLSYSDCIYTIVKAPLKGYELALQCSYPIQKLPNHIFLPILQSLNSSSAQVRDLAYLILDRDTALFFTQAMRMYGLPCFTLV